MTAEAPVSKGFGPRGSLRRKVGADGRIHVDRTLPFIVLHRGDGDQRASLARRVALTSSAYMAWSGVSDDKAALAALDEVLEGASRRFAEFLVIAVYDLPRPAPEADDTPQLPLFRVEIGASPDPHAAAAARGLADAAGKIEIDLRTCETRMLPAPEISARLGDHLADRGVSVLSIGLPRIHEAPDGQTTYPQVFHDLAVAIFDALLKSVCLFMADTGLKTPPHYRALGRSAFIDAARSVDTKLDRVCRSFDFLLSVSPINTTQAFAQFRADKYEKSPTFRYRPLTVDPSESKRELYGIDLRTVEDPVLEGLFAEKRLEIDHQLTMLEARNSFRFPFASLMLYEPVDSALRKTAAEILTGDRACDANDKARADCHAVADAAQTMVERYTRQDTTFAEVEVELRDDIPAGMMVSGHRLYISTATSMPAYRVEPLLHHEVGVHLLTFVNGSKQGLAIFKRGLAGYEGIQEGLGVFAEWAVGGLSTARLRLLAARVLAVDAMTDGADFISVFRLLTEEHDFSDETAFLITARVFRSGGLAKDAIYLRGFKAVLDRVAAGQSLDLFWYGKLDARHLPIIDELAERGILSKPRLTPEFLVDPEAAARLAAFRETPSYATLL